MFYATNSPFRMPCQRINSKHLLSSYYCQINCIHYAYSSQQPCKVRRTGIPVALLKRLREAEQSAKDHSADEQLSARIQSQAFPTLVWVPPQCHIFGKGPAECLCFGCSENERLLSFDIIGIVVLLQTQECSWQCGLGELTPVVPQLVTCG